MLAKKTGSVNSNGNTGISHKAYEDFTTWDDGSQTRTNSISEHAENGARQSNNEMSGNNGVFKGGENHSRGNISKNPPTRGRWILGQEL